MKTIQFSFWKCVHAIFPIFLFIFCFAFSSHATTYYVSSTGNDVTGNGTAGSPWKTLVKATTVVTTSGSIIHVNAGTYTETATCYLAIGVSIEGDGITSILRSAVTAFQSPLLRLTSADGTSGNQHISNLKFDGQSLATSWGIYVEGRSNVSINNCTVTNFGDRGVIFAATSGFAEAAPPIYATGNSFYNNTITNCAAFYGSYGTGCLNIGGQQNMDVYNNTIIQNQRPVGQNGWCIKHFQGGYWKNVKIYNNTITKIPWTGSYAGEFGWNFAIESYHHNGLEIYGNTITGGCIDLNYCSKGAYTYGAWIHDNNISIPALSASYHDAIHLEFSITDVLVENNTFNNLAGGVVFATRALDSINRVTIRKNLMSNLGKSQGDGNNGVGIGTYSEGTYDYTINGLNIYNNTIVAAQGFAPFEGIHINGVDNGHPGSITNLNIKNNIVQGFWESWLRINNGSFCNGLDVSYNNLYNNNSSNNPYITGGTPVSYTTSNNTNNVPLFVGGGNYALTASSTLIDKGVNVGLAYSGAAPDKGYVEAGVILPVQLINFGVTENRGKNLLQWTTAVESNSDYFSIERSSDGKNFTAIGTVKAAGFSSTDINYSFTDASPLTGINYYRLSQVDKDNSKNLSNTVAIINKSNESLNIATAQLSRSNNNMQVTVISAQNQKTSISLFDANGKLFLNETVQLQKGMNSIIKNTRALSSGIYYIKLSAADETVVKNVLSKE
jgi:hypothetical protein